MIKIIKHDKKLWECECQKCGCVFSYECEDIRAVPMFFGDLMKIRR